MHTPGTTHLILGSSKAGTGEEAAPEPCWAGQLAANHIFLLKIRNVHSIQMFLTLEPFHSWILRQRGSRTQLVNHTAERSLSQGLPGLE